MLMSMSAATAPTRPKMTLEAWSALPEDEPGELVDGELVEEEMPSFVHEVVVVWLSSMLRAWLAARGGFVGGSGVKLRVSARRGRLPDVVAFFARGKFEARGLVTVPPDIVVEVVSPEPGDQKRDRVDKLEEYAAFGVRYYWLVSPELRTIEILELGSDGRYVHAQNITTDRKPVVGCDGLVLDVDDLWREVERTEATGD